jgi:hypothetical protein
VVFEFFVGKSQTSVYSMPAFHVTVDLLVAASAAIVVCRDVDVFATKTVSLKHIL